MNKDRIMMAHGSGGKISHELISDFFLPKFDNEILKKLDDSAVFKIKGNRLAFTTDSYVINPIFFPGGDIGKLAIFGTVNDISMSGAVPLYISVGFVLEEGFLISDLEKILKSMKSAAKQAKVLIVCGDTKVVEKGSADKIFINTSGLGVIENGINISGENAKVGDLIIINGSIGDHGIAVISERGQFEFEIQIKSDCAPLSDLVQHMLSYTKNINVLRDPTRGGIATSLNEIAKKSKVSIEVRENKIRVKKAVIGACEMLGFDPMYVANEGKLIAIVSKKDAYGLLNHMKKHPLAKDSEIIGEVTEDKAGRVTMKTLIGSTRILDMMVGELLPRIC
jgi:hydrogenase expression/formation protein HypE